MSDDLKKALLKEVANAKRALKKGLGMSAEQARVKLREIAEDTKGALSSAANMTAEMSMELLVEAGIYDKAGNLTPEFGGKPVKKPKKPRRKE